MAAAGPVSSRPPVVIDREKVTKTSPLPQFSNLQPDDEENDLRPPQKLGIDLFVD
jgi:hypothetical protein